MATINGTGASNLLSGDTDGNLNDIISGLGGADTIYGLTGNDTIYGGSGADSLYGGDGNDVIYGGSGLDFVDGGDGNDTIFGGTDSGGDDTLYGGAGFDYLDYSDVGAVTVDLSAGTATGGGGTDVIGSIEGVIGGSGGDSITGDTLANHLIGNGGNDTLIGGAGNDTLDGGTGNDSIDGGADADLIFGGSGNDTILGGSGDDTIDGGTGNDSIDGGTGNDSIDGGSGNDSIDGGTGDDTIDGGMGNDTIEGGSGDDLITAGPAAEGSTGSVSLDFNWSDFPNQSVIDTGPGIDLTQDTGGIRVDVSLDGGSFGSTNRTENDDLIYVAPDDPFNSLSSAFIRRVGPSGDPVIINIAFSPTDDSGYADEVENVQFRISDIDQGTWRDRVVVRAYDADGNEVAVTFVNTSADLTVDGNTVSANPDAGNTDEAFADGSVLVIIAGPVARIEISYDNIGIEQQHIHISDIHFDAISTADDDLVTGGLGNDTILGGIGNDTLYGEADNDVLYGGADNDLLFGGDGNDTILGDAGTDTLYGGAGNDTFVILEGDVNAIGNDIIYGGGGLEEGGTGDGQDTLTDYDVIDLTAIGTDRITVVYTNTDPENLVGTIEIYTDASKTVLIGIIEFSEIERIILCFTPGTMIKTELGDVAVEMLQPGTMVMTRDNGLQPLRWTGARKVSATELKANPDLQPVRIAKGALTGQGPSRTMLVSPQHRVLIEGARAELLFGEAEVLVPAKHLVGQIDATRALPAEGVTYIHILFDNHEIVQSDGIWTESFQPAERTLSAMDAEVRAEVLALFPTLATDGDAYVGARLSLKAHEARVLLAK